jgi:hypothetical protein
MEYQMQEEKPGGMGGKRTGGKKKGAKKSGGKKR